jgi:hypothetical protein
VLGYDWLRTHNHMVCHWELKTLVTKCTWKGLNLTRNHLWQSHLSKWQNGTRAIISGLWLWCSKLKNISTIAPPSIIQEVLSEYQDVFAEATELPPQREYDHSIPLIPGAVPVNSRSYIYSPLHKDKIERHVKYLL